MNLAMFIPSEHEEIAGVTMVYIPSGKLLHNYGKSHVEWETHLFLCPFSVAMLNIVKLPEGKNCDKKHHVEWETMEHHQF